MAVTEKEALYNSVSALAIKVNLVKAMKDATN